MYCHLCIPVIAVFTGICHSNRHLLPCLSQAEYMLVNCVALEFSRNIIVELSYS